MLSQFLGCGHLCVYIYTTFLPPRFPSETAPTFHLFVKIEIWPYQNTLQRAPSLKKKHTHFKPQTQPSCGLVLQNPGVRGYMEVVMNIQRVATEDTSAFALEQTSSPPGGAAHGSINPRDRQWQWRQSRSGPARVRI